MRIRALTLWEPWATLVAIGAKLIETRSWTTSYRGPLAIHAAKRWRLDQRMMVWRSPLREALEEAGIDLQQNRPFALGCVVAVAELTDVDSTSRTRRLLWAQCKHREYAFGDYSSGRWAWHLENVRRLEEPVPATGRQGLWWWDVPERLVEPLGLAG